MNKKFLKNYQKEIQEKIWRLEIDTKTLEREKLGKPTEIKQIDYVLGKTKDSIEVWKRKLQIIDELLK